MTQPVLPNPSDLTAIFDQAPVKIEVLAPGSVFIDFGRVAFGNLRLLSPEAASNVTIRFGEALSSDGRIDRKPPGTVRYAEIEVALEAGKPLIAAPAADERNTRTPAVLLPPEWGVVLPFRWVEIEGLPGELRVEQVQRRAVFARTWQDDAASFISSDECLNAIWELCRYSIKATTFAGVYVDGDRERIAYEADTYINQISHYACDPDPQMARNTFDHLMVYPTWPTEWAHHMIFVAHADWMQTGDTTWIAERFDCLKAKLLEERALANGLLGSSEEDIRWTDLIDWPPDERDGFVKSPLNSVVNAFYLRALALMAEMARALGRQEEAAQFEARERAVNEVFQQTFFDAASGLYRDGKEVEHASAHANLFPLAFGLVPPEHRTGVVAFLLSKGMACSVYAAQYLMDGLFEYGDAADALALMTAPGDRSWRHMVESGTTITWEAWDQHYKTNQDWNHAWGAAPANLLPRYVLGVRAAEAGWKTVLVRPYPGTLQECTGKVPTPCGPVEVAWKRGEVFTLTITLPVGSGARVELPAAPGSVVRVNGRVVAGVQLEGRVQITLAPSTSPQTIEVA